jgi:hypothetical protein
MALKEGKKLSTGAVPGGREGIQPDQHWLSADSFLIGLRSDCIPMPIIALDSLPPTITGKSIFCSTGCASSSLASGAVR